MGAPASIGERLWRARKRHDAIDAVLAPTSGRWELQFVRNRRLFLAWRFDTAEAAVEEADRRLRDLQRAGWNTHW